jgi:hypothetical protein
MEIYDYRDSYAQVELASVDPEIKEAGSRNFQ